MTRRASLCTGVVSGLVAATIGCGHDTTGPRTLADQETYWALRFDQHAVTLSLTEPSNTIQLHATPTSLAGTSLPDSGAVEYSCSDSTVLVSSNGLITAKYTTVNGLAQVIAKLSLNNVTLQDTVLVKVTADAPSSPLATLSIHPPPGDSARFAQTGGRFFNTHLPVTATDQSGAVLSNASTDTLLLYFTSADPSIASIDRTSGVITPNLVGHVMLYVNTVAYGVAKRDSVLFTVTYPLDQGVVDKWKTPIGSLTPIAEFAPSTVTITVGGRVRWYNSSMTRPIDVVFDDPSAASSACESCTGPLPLEGNIAPFVYDTTEHVSRGYREREFRRVGTFHYHSDRYKTSGTIIVTNYPSEQTP